VAAILEKDLASKLIEWLTEQKWTIYQEVELKPGIADIIAVMGNKVWIIEVKTSLCLRVLAQAERWKSYATWRSIAIPSRRHNYEDLTLTKKICTYLGIGILNIPKSFGDPSILIDAQLNRSAKAKDVLKQLKPEHQTYAKAGSPTGRRWTGFKATSRDVTSYIAANPGCTLKDIIDNVATHYHSKSTAKSCIVEYIRKGIIPGIRTEKKGTSLHFYTTT